MHVADKVDFGLLWEYNCNAFAPSEAVCEPLHRIFSAGYLGVDSQPAMRNSLKVILGETESGELTYTADTEKTISEKS